MWEQGNGFEQRIRRVHGCNVSNLDGGIYEIPMRITRKHIRAANRGCKL